MDLEAAKRGFDNQPFMAVIGAALTDLGKGRCTITLPFDNKLTQQHGFIHGGVIATLADNAAGFAAYTLMAQGYQPLTIEFKLNYLEPAKAALFKAQATVLKAGRSLSHLKSDVFAVENNRETLIAAALVTIKATRAVSEIG